MDNKLEPTDSSGIPVPIIVSVVVTGLLVFVACFLVWHLLGGGAWRSEVRVDEVVLLAPERLELIVFSCHGAPRVSSLLETGDEVNVKVVAYSTPFRGGLECQDAVEIYLQGPLGDRVVVDKHTGLLVNVSTLR